MATVKEDEEWLDIKMNGLAARLAKKGTRLLSPKRNRKMHGPSSWQGERRPLQQRNGYTSYTRRKDQESRIVAQGCAFVHYLCPASALGVSLGYHLVGQSHQLPHSHTVGLGLNGLVRNFPYHGFAFFGPLYSSVSSMGNRNLGSVTARYSAY